MFRTIPALNDFSVHAGLKKATKLGEIFFQILCQKPPLYKMFATTDRKLSYLKIISDIL